MCAEFAYNNKIHTAMHVSPLYANYGMNPRMGIEPWRAGKSEPAKEFAEWMKTVHEEAQVALSKSCNDMTCYADFHRGEAPEYKVGDKVWLSIKNLNIDQPSCKLAERQLGPYKIIKITSPNAVKLKLPTSFKIHDVINISHICPYLLRHTKPITRLSQAYKNQTTEMWREKFILTRSPHTRL